MKTMVPGLYGKLTTVPKMDIGAFSFHNKEKIERSQTKSGVRLKVCRWMRCTGGELRKSLEEKLNGAKRW